MNHPLTPKFMIATQKNGKDRVESQRTVYCVFACIGSAKRKYPSIVFRENVKLTGYAHAHRPMCIHSRFVEMSIDHWPCSQRRVLLESKLGFQGPKFDEEFESAVSHKPDSTRPNGNQDQTHLQLESRKPKTWNRARLYTEGKIQFFVFVDTLIQIEKKTMQERKI